MSAAPRGDVRSIDCTNCGAGLPVLGGGRVITQICGYCGAALDATDAFRVLEVYAGMDRPDTPFRLGMEGDLDGVRWTIIGTLGLEERWDGQVEAWVDHMLYSPTHGYAWLTVEDGHTILTRKTRDWPRAAWLTPRTVERAANRPGRSRGGRNYIYYQSGEWSVTFAEGAFNFRPARGDRGTSIALLSHGERPEMLTYLEPHGAREREVELSHYVPGAAAAFGAEPPRPRGVHPLQPYRGGGAGFYRLWFGAMTIAAFAMIWVALAMGGRPEVILAGGVDELPQSMSVEVTDTERPLRLRLATDMANSWADFDLSVTGPDGNAIAQTFLPVSFYAGREGGENWTEGSRSATIGLDPQVAGPHTVTLGAPVGDAALSGRVTAVELTMREGLMTVRWPIGAMVIFALLFVWSLTGRLRHRWRAASGSDWSEED